MGTIYAIQILRLKGHNLIVAGLDRDFRGLNPKSFDGHGNYSLGLNEQLMFPEIDYDKIDQIQGMDISIITTARTDEEARALLSSFGMPFKKK